MPDEWHGAFAVGLAIETRHPGVLTRLRMPSAISEFERAIRATTWNTPGVMTAIACGWLEDGTVTRLESEKRQDASVQQAIAAEALGRLKRVCHPASYFVWLPLAQEVRADRIAAALMRSITASASQASFRDACASSTTPFIASPPRAVAWRRSIWLPG
jgi:DNA-binding transcriptional MocR family regulator